MPKIAAYTICKNEAKHVLRWLDTTEGADCRVIVDTGSDDGTYELLEREFQRYKAGQRSPIYLHRISVSPWRFDDARNAALAHVPDDVDVCLILDMDELCAEGFFQTIREKWSERTTRGWVTIDTGYKWTANRLHARKGFRWIRPIHEVCVPYGELPQLEQVFETSILHKPDIGKSRAHYLEMLEQAVRELPDDGRMWAYLVREYSYREDWANVLHHAPLALKRFGMAHERGYICRLAAQGAHAIETPEKAFEWLLRAVEEAPKEPESQYALAEWSYHQKDWERTKYHAEEALRLPSGNHYISDAAIHKWRAYDLISIAYFHLGDKRKALDFAARAANGNPADTRLINNLDWLANNQ